MYSNKNQYNEACFLFEDNYSNSACVYRCVEYRDICPLPLSIQLEVEGYWEGSNLKQAEWQWNRNFACQYIYYGCCKLHIEFYP
jgi:hypothetical protein